MKDGNHISTVAIPEQFIRRTSVSIKDAVLESSELNLNSQNLCAATRMGTTVWYPHNRPLRDLQILEMLAKGSGSHLDFMNLIRPVYNVEVEMAWDDPQGYESDEFLRIKMHLLFNLFVPEIVCRIEDHDMYEFTTLGPNYSNQLNGNKDSTPRQKKIMENVSNLFNEVPKLTPTRFAVFLGSILDVSESMNSPRINFTLLWNLYQKKHKKCKQSASKQNVLSKFLETDMNSKAYLAENGIIWISRLQELPNMLPIEVETKHAEFRSNQYFVEYRNYLTTFVNSLTHAKCASKFTRVSKLYSKSLKFNFVSSDETFLESSFSNFQKKFKYFSKSKFSRKVSSDSDAQKRVFQKLATRMKHAELSDAMSPNQEKFSGYELISSSPDHEYWVLPEEKTKHKIDRVRSTSLTDRIGEGTGTKRIENSIFDKYITELNSKNGNVTLDDVTFMKWHQKNGVSIIPLVINGGAGMGKTIRLTQFALSYARGLLGNHDLDTSEPKQAFHLPIFIKAKRVKPQKLQERFQRDSMKGVPAFLTPLIDIMVDSNPDLLNHQSKEELRDAITNWIVNEDLHGSGFVFFIDGLDECVSRQAGSDLVNWLMALELDKPPTIILSTRPSHYDIAAKIIGEHGRVDMLVDKEYYSKQELSQDIPMRLCDAWGMTRHSARTLSQVFSSYESILQHPLFVGWFCFLILNDEVEDLGAMEQDSDIARNNLISNIISIGIKSSLERREAEFSGSEDDPASDEFLRILRIFVAVAFHFDLARPEQIYHHMKMYKLVGEISPSIRTSIEEHCGILFLTADNVEWTHRTIPELMYADFYFDHPEIHHWGPLKATSPVVSRLAQLSYENGDANSYGEAMVRLSFVHDYHYFNELRMDTWIDCENEGRYLIGLDDANNLIPIKDGNHPHETQLAELFIENLQTISCFPLYYDLLEPSRKRETVQKILTYSNDPFGRDLITPEDEINLVHIDDVRTELVLRTTKIADCFEYYRMILADFRCLPDSKLDLSHDVFSIHKKAQNPEHLFFINHISGWAKHMVWESGHARTWLGPWLVNKKSNKDAEFYTEVRMELIKFITEEYVETAYRALFGSDHWEDLLNTVFEQTREVEIDIVVGSGEYVDVERRNLLNHYMARHNLNDLVSVDSIHQSPANILDNYDTENLFVRGIVMMPFIAECLRFNEGQEDGDLAQFLEEQPNFTAFNIISNYSSRLITKDEQS